MTYATYQCVSVVRTAELLRRLKSKQRRKRKVICAQSACVCVRVTSVDKTMMCTPTVDSCSCPSGLVIIPLVAKCALPLEAAVIWLHLLIAIIGICVRCYQIFIFLHVCCNQCLEAEPSAKEPYKKLIQEEAKGCVFDELPPPWQHMKLAQSVHVV